MHAQYAPLSHAQTVAVSRHLQDQIKALEGQVQDAITMLKVTQDAVDGLRKSMPTPNSNAEVKIRDDVRNLQVVTEDTNAALGRTDDTVVKLEDAIGSTNDNVIKLTDEMKHNKIAINKNTKELSDQTARVLKMQHKMERKIELDLTSLGDGLSTAENNIKSLRVDTQFLMEGLRDEKEEMRRNNLRALEAADKFKELEIKFLALQNRVEDNTLGRKALKIDSEEITITATKLRDDHEHTKGNVQEIWSRIKAMHEQVKALQGRLDATSTNLVTADDKLRQQMAETEDLKRAADHALNGVHALGESHGSSSHQINSMQSQLTQLAGSVMSLRAGLKEQSSLLLPNITLEHGEARAASARHGSLLCPGVATGGFGRTTPPSRAVSARSRANTPQLWT